MHYSSRINFLYRYCAHFLVFTLVFLSNVTFAQKQVLINNEAEVIKRAQQELDEACKSGGIIYTEAIARGVKGSHTFDITVHKKGEVLTVFAPFDITESVINQNAMKDIARRFVFSFKLPKDKRYKFRYTFNF